LLLFLNTEENWARKKKIRTRKRTKRKRRKKSSLTTLKSWKTANLLAVRNTKKAKKNAARVVLCLIYSKKLPNKIDTKPTKKFGGFLVLKYLLILIILQIQL
jgi:hypothetical protein